MNPIAEYKIKTIRGLLGPDMPECVTDEDLRKTLEMLRRRNGLTVREASELFNVTLPALKMRIYRAKIAPIVPGVRRSRRKASRYSVADIQRLVAKEEA